MIHHRIILRGLGFFWWVYHTDIIHAIRRPTTAKSIHLVHRNGTALPTLRSSMSSWRNHQLLRCPEKNLQFHTCSILHGDDPIIFPYFLWKIPNIIWVFGISGVNQEISVAVLPMFSEKTSSPGGSSQSSDSKPGLARWRVRTMEVPENGGSQKPLLLRCHEF